jgi:hypothetical protein
MKPPALLAVLVIAVLNAAACGGPSVVAPTTPSAAPAPAPPNPPGPPAEVIDVYRATFAVSHSCASALPAAAQERTYTARLLSDGRIDWSGPTLNPPSGHRTISSGTLTEDVFSFNIDIDRDPQSDDFHGLWDEMGGGTTLNISGKGSGTTHDGEIIGLLNGVFAFYEPVADRNVLRIGRYCSAADHRFRFVPQ